MIEFPSKRVWFRAAGVVLLGCALPAAPSEPTAWSPRAQALIRKAFEGLDPARPVLDLHVHAVGNGKGASGSEVNPELRSLRHPKKRLSTQLYLQACGVPDDARFDEAYVDRISALAKGFGRPVSIHLLAMDRYYNPDGTANPARTEFYVPNDHVIAMAKRDPEHLVPVASIHPNRKDALTELDRCAALGVRWVKWLPNAQGIDPSEARHEAFYQKMKALKMVLLTHAGEEKAVDAEGAQAFGNPLHLRKPLDLGVTVVVAHCASLGENEDLDAPGKPKISNFELFLRLMREPKYRGLLFGDLSAMTQVNRMPGPLQFLLRQGDLQERLVNGSDYPLPAIGLMIWTRQHAALRMISLKERKALNEVFRRNPLLFDFVLKRTLKDPKTGQRLSEAIFQRMPVPVP